MLAGRLYRVICALGYQHIFFLKIFQYFSSFKRLELLVFKMRSCFQLCEGKRKDGLIFFLLEKSVIGS